MRWALALFLALTVVQPVNPVSFPVTTFKGPAHVCPVDDNLAFTARHVAMNQFSANPRDMAALPVYWRGGLLSLKNFSYTLDVASMTTDKPFPYHYEVSPVEPKIGDKVRITGYDHGKGMRQITVEAKIVNFLPGTMILDHTPGPGSSGSCVFNSDGEVIGINFGIIKDEEAGKHMGYAVVLEPRVLEGLYGDK